MKNLPTIILRLAFSAVLAAAAIADASEPAAGKGGAPREMRWSDLIPKNWNPMQELRKLDPTIDADTPKALQLMREVWDRAPPVAALDGTAIKLPGYVVPLDSTQGALKEFLLVPYFGACIHTPPPPANQIIHVVTATPAKGSRAMDVVWVVGTLQAKRVDSWMGVSGYRIDGAALEPYVKKKP